jgi:hypothetical protein
MITLVTIVSWLLTAKDTGNMIADSIEKAELGARIATPRRFNSICTSGKPLTRTVTS